MTHKEHLSYLKAIAEDLHELYFDTLTFKECLFMAIEYSKSKSLDNIDNRLSDRSQQIESISELIHSISQSIDN